MTGVWRLDARAGDSTTVLARVQGLRPLRGACGALDPGCARWCARRMGDGNFGNGPRLGELRGLDPGAWPPGLRGSELFEDLFIVDKIATKALPRSTLCAIKIGMGAVKQLLLDDTFRFNSCSGGDYATGRRKTARPFSSKKPIHLVLRSDHAKGELSFRKPKHRKLIAAMIENKAKQYGIKIYRYSINSNHLHIVLHSKYRTDFQNFLRTLTGQIAQRLTGALKGLPFGKFWTKPPFTRLLEWGKAFAQALHYVFRNQLEASGKISYAPRSGPARPSRDFP